MLSAYSRDPRTIFVLPEHMAREGYAKALQPVVFRNATLPAVGAAVYETRVHWHNGEVACFADDNDAINNVPFWQTVLKVQCAAPRPCDEYVREVFAFMQRGHSMLHPECQCRHGLSDERAVELGVPPDADDRNMRKILMGQKASAASVCLVRRDRTRRSFAEIARELNIENLNGLVKNPGSEEGFMELRQVLVRFAGMQETGPGFLHSSMCCVPPLISTAQDVVDAARIMAPFPFSINTEELKKMMTLLQKDTRLTMFVDKKPGNETLHIFATEENGRKADADIRQLWHTTVEPERDVRGAQALDRTLVAAGLRPMRTHPAPPPAKPPPKLSQKRASTTSLAATKRKAMQLTKQSQ